MTTAIATSSRRDFRLLWAGQAVSQLGSRTFGVAYMLWVLALTRSAATVGVIASTMLGAYTLAQLPGGVLCDRVDRRRLMVACDASSGLAVASVAVAAAARTFSLPHLLTVALVLGAGWAVRGTAEMTALPRVVAPDELERAVLLVEGRSYATGLAGPALAGQLFAAGHAVPFVGDAASYLAAAVCAARVRTPLSSRPDGDGERHGGVRDGLRAFWAAPFVRTTALLGAAGEFAVNALGLTLIVLMRDAGVGSQRLGLVLAAAMAGGMAGTVISSRLERSGVPARLALIASPLSAAVALAAIAFAGGLVWTAVAYAGVFVLRPSWHAITESRWLTIVDPEVVGRVQAGANLVMSVPLVATPAIAGVLVAAAGPRATCVVLAAVMALVALATARSRAVASALREAA